MLNYDYAVDIVFSEGFYDLETDGTRYFRWMRKKSSIIFQAFNLNLLNTGKLLKIELGNADNVNYELNILEDDYKYNLSIIPGWNEYRIFLKGKTEVLKFSCESLLNTRSDSRELSLMVGKITLKEVGEEETVFELSGFNEKETDGMTLFRWMEKNAKIQILKSNQGEWLLCEIKSPSSWPEKLYFKNESTGIHREIHILPGEWKTIGIPIEELGEAGSIITLYTEFIQKCTDDKRNLTFMISNFRISVPSAYELNSSILHREVFKKTYTESKGTLFCIDTGSNCNLNCKFCIIDYNDKNCKTDNITKEKTKKFIYNNIYFASKLQPYISGEPLCSKDIWNLLYYVEKNVNDHKVEIEISTNGLLINDEIINNIIKYKISGIQISVNSTCEKTYKRICGGDFNILKDNISKLSKHIRKNNISGINLSLNYVLMRENMQEVYKFPEIAKDLGIEKIQIWPLNKIGIGIKNKYSSDGFLFNYQQQLPDYYPKLLETSINKTIEKAQELGISISITPIYNFSCSTFTEDIPYPIDINKFYNMIENLEYIKKYEQSVKYKLCYFPWYNICVTGNGTFAPCIHMIYKGGVDNVIDKDFFEIWNSEKMQKLRRDIIKGNVNEMCRNAQCPFVQSCN